MSIIVNSRNIFCLGWKSDRSLATQNKKDDLSDNLDNIRDNLKQLFFYTTIRFATKICKVLFISHGRARMNTDTRNISVDQCNQWEQRLPQIAQIDTDTRNI